MEGSKRLENVRWRHAAGFVRSLWLAVGLTILLLAALEGVARVDLLFSSPDADRRIRADAYPPEPWVAELYQENARSARLRWESYVNWRRLPFAGKHINIDDRGLRRTWQPPAAEGKPPLKIFFFGASAVWGTGVRDDHTIPSELGRYLYESGVPADVSNFGETGWVSTQSVIALLRELQRDNVPDLAIFYGGSNDTFSTFQNRAPGLPQNEPHRVREFNLLRHARRLVRETLGVIADRSRLVNLIRSAAPPAPAPGPPPGLVDETLRVLDANLAAADALATRWGFRINVFWEPCLFTKRHLTPWEERRSGPLEYARGWLLSAYDRVRHDWASRDPGEFTYLGDLFAETEGPRFVDHSHTSEVANREIAEAIGRQLIAHGRLRRRDAGEEPAARPSR